jgi:hypothetical protein
MKLIREMWPAYLIEILVIILGISITLGLEAWRDGIKEKRQEKIYLRNLKADLEEDMNSLTWLIQARSFSCSTEMKFFR